VTDCHSRCSRTPLPLIGGEGEPSTFGVDARRGISPFFNNGYLQGSSLGVSGPVVAGRVFGIAVSDTAHVSTSPVIPSQAVAVLVCGLVSSARVVETSRPLG